MLKKIISFALIALLSVATVSLLATSAESTVNTQQSQGTFEYAQLIVQGDLAELGDNGIRVRWLQGDRNLVPQFVTVESLNRLLSRRASFSSFNVLLDTIGGQGWELVDVRAKSNSMEYWVFRRQR